ncbi:hypothetical protein JOE65_000723 [Arthrobacter roseus]|nr:hypothetical protein [Arthrobacter roseus]
MSELNPYRCDCRTSPDGSCGVHNPPDGGFFYYTKDEHE